MIVYCKNRTADAKVLMLRVHPIALAEQCLSFFDVKTVNEKLCNSFHMVCRKVCNCVFSRVSLLHSCPSTLEQKSNIRTK